MIAYGYPKDRDIDFPEKLLETSLLCTKEELDRIIVFLQNVQRNADGLDPVDGFHSHFRDFDNNWKTSHSDFIICLTDKEAP